MRFVLWTPYEVLTREEKIEIVNNAIEFYARMPGEIAMKMVARRQELLRQLIEEPKSNETVS